MGMYEVCAKCGHVGRYNYVEKVFAVIASDGKEAAAKVRQFPRVKHDQNDAIRYVRKISEERYIEIINMNKMDPFFRCHNIQEQRKTCNMEVKREDRVEHGEKHGKLRQKRPRQPIKRMSSSKLINIYYNEVGPVC